MSIFVIDIEADGPIPGDFSMISFGAVLLNKSLDIHFYGQLKPISKQYIPEALAVSGFTRKQTEEFESPRSVMAKFSSWLTQHSLGRPKFISDNNGFDWMFMCWYFHHFLGENPFGYSSQNLGSIYKGLEKDMNKSFKHLRKTRHTHHPVDDAKGNAEALLHMIEKLGLKHMF